MFYGALGLAASLYREVNTIDGRIARIATPGPTYHKDRSVRSPLRKPTLPATPILLATVFFLVTTLGTALWLLLNYLDGYRYHIQHALFYSPLLIAFSAGVLRNAVTSRVRPASPPEPNLKFRLIQSAALVFLVHGLFLLLTLPGFRLWGVAAWLLTPVLGWALAATWRPGPGSPPAPRRLAELALVWPVAWIAIAALADDRQRAYTAEAPVLWLAFWAMFIPWLFASGILIRNGFRRMRRGKSPAKTGLSTGLVAWVWVTLAVSSALPVACIYDTPPGDAAVCFTPDTWGPVSPDKTLIIRSYRTECEIFGHGFVSGPMTIAVNAMSPGVDNEGFSLIEREFSAKLAIVGWKSHGVFSNVGVHGLRWVNNHTLEAVHDQPEAVHPLPGAPVEVRGVAG